MTAKKAESVFFDSNVYIKLLRSAEYEQKIERFLHGAYLYAVSKIVLMELGFEPRMRGRLTWDILIALSAKENNSLLITENAADFRKICKYVDFDFVSAVEGEL
jgi:predicted nucleic acid-binding protein